MKRKSNSGRKSRQIVVDRVKPNIVEEGRDAPLIRGVPSSLEGNKLEDRIFKNGEWLRKSACVHCGIMRFVRYRNGFPLRTSCRSCAAKIKGNKSWNNKSVEERAAWVRNVTDGIRKVKAKHSDSMKRYWASKTPDERKAHYKKTMGTEDAKSKVAKSVKKVWDGYTPEEKQTRLNNSSHSEKARLGRIANWEKLSPDEKLNWIKVHLRRRHWKMTGIEKIVSDYLDKHFPDEWKYNGCRNYNVVINGKIPDFINVNSKKAVIEVLGLYWHKKEEVEKLKSHYSKYGFSCVIIWEDECNDVDLNRILSEVY